MMHLLNNASPELGDLKDRRSSSLESLWFNAALRDTLRSKRLILEHVNGCFRTLHIKTGSTLGRLLVPLGFCGSKANQALANLR